MSENCDSGKLCTEFFLEVTGQELILPSVLAANYCHYQWMWTFGAIIFLASDIREDLPVMWLGYTSFSMNSIHT